MQVFQFLRVILHLLLDSASFNDFVDKKKKDKKYFAD